MGELNLTSFLHQILALARARVHNEVFVGERTTSSRKVRYEATDCAGRFKRVEVERRKLSDIPRDIQKELHEHFKAMTAGGFSALYRDDHGAYRVEESGDGFRIILVEE